MKKNRTRPKMGSGGLILALMLALSLTIVSVSVGQDADEVSNVVEKIAKDMGNLAKDLKAKQQAYEDLAKKFEQLQEKNTFLTNQLEIKEKTIAKKEGQIISLRQKLNNVDQLFTKSQIAIKTLEESKTEIKKQLRQLQEDVSKKESYFDQKLQQDQEKIVKLTELVEDLKKDNKKLAASEQSYAKQAESQEQQISALKARLENQENTYQENLSTLQQETVKQLEDIQQREKRLREELQTAKQESNVIVERNQQIEADNKDYQKRIDGLRQKLTDKEKQLSVAQEELQEMERYYTEKYIQKEKSLKEELVKLQAESKDVSQMKQQYEDDIQGLIKQNKKKEATILSQRVLIKQKDEELLQQRAQHKLLISEKDRMLEKDLTAYKQKNEQLMAQNDKLVNEKKQLLLKLISMDGKQADGRVRALAPGEQGSLTVANEEIDFLKTEFTNLNKILNKSYQELTILKEKNNKMANENLELLSLVADYKKQIEDKEKKLELTEELIAEKEKEYLKKLEENKNQLSSELKEFRGLVGELEKKNELTNRDRENYLSQLDELKQQYTNLREEFAKVEKDKNSLAKRVQGFYKKERQWQKKDEQQIRLLAKYADSIDELKQRISDLSTENKGLELQIKAMPERISKMEKEVSDLRLQNSALHYNLGVFHTQRQEYTQAVSEFRKSLKFNDQDPSTHYNLGIIYSRYLIDELKAISHFKHYLALSPNDKDAQKAKEYLLIWGTQENVR